MKDTLMKCNRLTGRCDNKYLAHIVQEYGGDRGAANEGRFH